MTMLLPEEAEGSEIGHRAVKAFQAQMPDTWRFQDLSGDSDAGLDAFIQVVANGRYSYAFHTQIKGSTISAYSSDRSFVSVGLRISTLNYYRALGFPVMLVFADFSADEGPRECPIYYLWIHEGLDEALSEVPPDAVQSSRVTFRIPTTQRLSDELDVVPYLATASERRVQLHTLERAIAGVPQESSVPTVIGRIAENVSKRGASFLESTLAASDTPWSDPLPGTIAWTLKELNDRITDGATEEALAHLERINPALLRDAQESAELCFLKGRLARLTGDVSGVISGFSDANCLLPATPRYFCAWLEARLLTAADFQLAGPSLLTELEKSSCADDPRSLALRARIFIVLDRFSEADDVLTRIPVRVASVERVLSLLAQSRLDEAVESAHEAQSLDIGLHTILALRILSLRARFQKLFGAVGTTPATGPPDIDSAELHALWRDLCSVLNDLASARWPPNSELAVDIVAPVSAALDKAGEALVFIESFLRAKPFHEELQISRLSIAILAGNFKSALDAADRLPTEEARTVHKVLIHYEAGRFHQATKLVPSLVSLPKDAHVLLPEAVVAGAHSAHRTFNRTAEDQSVSWLRAAGYVDRIEVLKFFFAGDGDATARQVAKRELIDAYRRDPASIPLQEHVLRALNPSDPDDALAMVQVFDSIGRRRQLRPDDVVVLSEAFNSLQRSAEALKVLEAARLRFPEDPQLTASAALIYERKGEVTRARSLLRGLLVEDESSEVARSAYINIAARSGLLEEAIGLLESLFADAETADKKKVALKALFSLEVYRDRHSPRLVTLARGFGRLSNAESEGEEGAFLQMMMVAGQLSSEEGQLQIYQQEVRARAFAYAKKFPNSTHFGAIELAPGSDVADLERLLKRRFGVSSTAIDGLARFQRRASRGDLPIPFAWRPKIVVPAARSIAELWELTKRAVPSQAILGFAMDQQRRDIPDLRRESRVPLIDLLSLLIITDLDLWPKLFRVFERIAITKETLLRIQGDEDPFFDPSPTISALRRAIRTYVDKIEQPGAVREEWYQSRDGGLEDMQSLSRDGHFLFYSDDLITRVYVLGDAEAENSLTTGQLLRFLEQQGYISARDVGHCVAQLTRWNVGFLMFEDRHLVACLPDSLFGKTNLDEKILILFYDPDYQALVSGIWDPPKKFDEIVGQVVGLLSFILRYNSDLDDGVLAAIWASWLDKAKLRPEVGFSIEERLAVVLVHTCNILKDTENGSRKMWRAFLALVQRHYSDRMDEAHEKAAYQLVGKTVASFANSNEQFRKAADDILAAVRKGLTPRTADYDYVMEGFKVRREEHAAALASRRG